MEHNPQAGRSMSNPNKARKKGLMDGFFVSEVEISVDIVFSSAV
jgi:hypothetical protein